MTPTEVWILGFRYRIIGRREDAPDWIQSMSEQTFTAITADGFCDTKWHVIFRPIRGAAGPHPGRDPAGLLRLAKPHAPR